MYACWKIHVGNTEEENKGYVVFKLNIHGSDVKDGGGEVTQLLSPAGFRTIETDTQE
jgi:hypothetical protein